MKFRNHTTWPSIQHFLIDLVIQSEFSIVIFSENTEVFPKQQMQNLYPIHFSDVYVLLRVRSILNDSQVSEERFAQKMLNNSKKIMENNSWETWYIEKYPA